MASKNNIRSIRFDDRTFELIEQQIGNNFTEKFENLVRRCIWELPQKEAQLNQLEREISQKKRELQLIKTDIMEMNVTLNAIAPKLKTLTNYIHSETSRWEP